MGKVSVVLSLACSIMVNLRCPSYFSLCFSLFRRFVTRPVFMAGSTSPSDPRQTASGQVRGNILNIKKYFSTLSGFKHIFWSIIVCVAMGCAAIFLYSNTIDFMNATVVTTVDTMTVPLSEVFFPSVVVCNINQVGLYVSQLSKKIKWVLLRK